MYACFERVKYLYMVAGEKTMRAGHERPWPPTPPRSRPPSPLLYIMHCRPLFVQRPTDIVSPALAGRSVTIGDVRLYGDANVSREGTVPSLRGEALNGQARCEYATHQ